MEMRTLSSNLTFFWKFIFPVLWFAGSGYATFAAFTAGHGVAQNDKWFSLASWPLGCFVCFCLQVFRLKRVRMDGEFLDISNYVTEAKVPLRDVRMVSVLTIRSSSARGTSEMVLKPFAVVEFQGQTPFGKRVVFMARGITVVSEPWTHPVISELRQAVDRALTTTPGESAPRDLGRAWEEARRKEARRRTRPGKPTLPLQERYLRRSRLLWHLFGIPGAGFLVGLVFAMQGAGAASINFAKAQTVGAGVSAAVLIGISLFLVAYFVQVLRFWLSAPARLVPYFERPLGGTKWGAFKKTIGTLDFKVSSEPLDTATWGAFRRGFALAHGLDVLERRASQLGVTPLSAFGFGDDVLGQIVVWHSASAGLQTVRALIASSHREALGLNLLEDLHALEVALQMAEAAALRFAIVVRIGSDEWIHHSEMSQRDGSFW